MHASFSLSVLPSFARLNSTLFSSSLGRATSAEFALFHLHISKTGLLRLNPSAQTVYQSTLGIGQVFSTTTFFPRLFARCQGSLLSLMGVCVKCFTVFLLTNKWVKANILLPRLHENASSVSTRGQYFRLQTCSAAIQVPIFWQLSVDGIPVGLDDFLHPRGHVVIQRTEYMALCGLALTRLFVRRNTVKHFTHTPISESKLPWHRANKRGKKVVVEKT